MPRYKDVRIKTFLVLFLKILFSITLIVIPIILYFIFFYEPPSNGKNGNAKLFSHPIIIIIIISLTFIPIFLIYNKTKREIRFEKKIISSNHSAATILFKSLKRRDLLYFSELLENVFPYKREEDLMKIKSSIKEYLKLKERPVNKDIENLFDKILPIMGAPVFGEGLEKELNKEGPLIRFKNNKKIIKLNDIFSIEISYRKVHRENHKPYKERVKPLRWGCIIYIPAKIDPSVLGYIIIFDENNEFFEITNNNKRIRLLNDYQGNGPFENIIKYKLKLAQTNLLEYNESIKKISLTFNVILINDSIYRQLGIYNNQDLLNLDDDNFSILLDSNKLEKIEFVYNKISNREWSCKTVIKAKWTGIPT